MVKMHDAKLTQIEQAAMAATVDTAKAVLKQARANAPKDEGKLARSGRVEVGFNEVSVAFRAPHAWLQHERLDYQHPQGGQAKYLEAAVDQVGASRAIVDGVRARLKR